MKEYKNTEITAKHVICHNNLDVFHYSVVESNDGLVTGQPFMEIFNSIEEAKEAFPQIFPEEQFPTISNDIPF
jgi:hypothetical protein